MDTAKLLGKIITEEAERDAVHIAVAPVKAAGKLYPGQHVGLLADGRAAVKDVEKIGIVDPFLPGPVFEGQMFWLWLYPGSITTLRHDWTHAAFDGEKKDA